MAGARDIPGIAPDATFREAAASAVETRAEEVFSFRDRVLDTSDIEGVHDMRVATRRLRAVMEIFAVCFPKKQHRRLLDEVKLLADTLGERRDPDVMIDGLEKVAGALTKADRAGIEHLEDTLRSRQSGANERLAALLERIESERLRERLVALAAEALEA
ncbi:MAG: exopolyphosphatase / guanosine-5-triphosphate,3-diphosphate pyrophosphatase [Thermoleophilaceae bacterium]|nr:exopolyphosphatase / guanosine-5-triphosphate,3-diphosphate pyrophosphatase [Thermoleophilaceae bacterium]